MVEIPVERLEKVTGAKPFTDSANRICKGVVIDSRQMTEDAIFVAFSGERVDGNDYAAQAIEAGAACVVLTRKPKQELLHLADKCKCAVFTTEDPEEFLLRLAGEYRAHMHCVVVAVTGSIGKTTTKDILAALLATRYLVHVTCGNYNNLIGMPLTILSAPPDTQIMILEMGMDGLGQIERLSSCARPSYAVITKIGTSHLGLLGSRENIARAKAEVLVGMLPSSQSLEGHSSKLVLCGEDDFTPFIVKNFAKPAGVDVLQCGVLPDVDVLASNIKLDQDGHPHFDVSFHNGASFEAKLSITGRQSVINALYAIAVAHELGVADHAIVQVLNKLQITAGRQEFRRAASGARIIDDSYNASPESMAAGLDLLSELPCTGERWAILGEIGELGEKDEPYFHALVGAYAASKKLDHVIFVGADNARAMADACRLMGQPEASLALVPNCECLCQRYAHGFESHDVVLIKGSHFVGLERFAEEVCAC